MAHENPHFAHGLGVAGLVHNLQNLPPEWGGAIFTRAYAPQRLAAISRQAENIKTQTLVGVQTAGNLLAQAAQTGELSAKDAANVGWLIEFLGELATAMDVLGDNARHALEHGPLTDPPAP